MPVFAHRVPVEPVPQQDAPQIRMPVKLDAVQVVDFPLLQIRARVNRCGAGDGIVLRHPHMQRDRAAAAPRAVEVVDYLQALVDTGAQLAAVPLVIDARQIGEKVVARRIAQMGQHVQDSIRRDHKRRLSILGPRAHDRVCQILLKPQIVSGRFCHSSCFSHSTFPIYV